MTVAAARLGRRLLRGISLPSAACNLARLTHAPKLALVYESGTIETKPTCCRFLSAWQLYTRALTTVSVLEMFNAGCKAAALAGFLWRRANRRDATSTHRDWRHAKPKVQLPGSSGAAEIATSPAVYIVMRQGPRSFVRSWISSRRSTWAHRPRAPRDRSDDGRPPAAGHDLRDGAERRDEGFWYQPASGVSRDTCGRRRVAVSLRNSDRNPAPTSDEPRRCGFERADRARHAPRWNDCG